MPRRGKRYSQLQQARIAKTALLSDEHSTATEFSTAGHSGATNTPNFSPPGSSGSIHPPSLSPPRPTDSTNPLFNFTVTNAASYTANVIGKSDKTVRRWRNDLIANKGHLKHRRASTFWSMLSLRVGLT